MLDHVILYSPQSASSVASAQSLSPSQRQSAGRHSPDKQANCPEWHTLVVLSGAMEYKTQGSLLAKLTTVWLVICVGFKFS